MKKLVIVLLAILVLMIGSVTFAQVNNNYENDSGFSFERMLPFMQDHHPNMTDSELQRMYESCHGSPEQSK